MKKGRPTIKQRKQIQEKIISLFVNGLSPKTIVTLTKYDKKTVYKHIKEFSESSKENEEFEKKLSNIVNHALLSFDNQLHKALEFKKELDDKSKKEGHPRYLLSLRANQQKFIADLIDKRFSYAIQVVADEFEVNK